MTERIARIIATTRKAWNVPASHHEGT